MNIMCVKILYFKFINQHKIKIHKQKKRSQCLRKHWKEDSRGLITFGHKREEGVYNGNKSAYVILERPLIHKRFTNLIDPFLF